MENLYPDIKTRRGLQNKYYEIHALGVLKDLEGMKFILDSKLEKAKWGILRELGRFKNEADMVSMAKWICKKTKKERHTIREWGKIIRGMRIAISKWRMV